MNILIVGSGAREHALAEKVSQSALCEKLYFAPGNGGTRLIGENINIQATDLEGLVDFAEKNNIDFTIVGPEDPLNLGIVDVFEERGLKIFGPRKAAAKLEGSKAFAKDFMVRHNIPTGEYIETSNLNQAIDFTKKLLQESSKAVIKADGLCAGKGVFIVDNLEEGEKYLREILQDGSYGIKKVIIEEFLQGFEMSLIAFVDNNNIKMLPTSKDHKNIFDKDQGLNTGGMGTYSPNIQANPYLEEIEDQILLPFLKGLQVDKMDFRGVIFIGLMITASGIKVLEFNTRFGDPETQSILNRLDSDLLDIMIKTSEDRLDQAQLSFNDKKVVTLILASGGYPEKYEKGFEITGLEKLEGVKIYHAGTKFVDQKLVTSGGRVLSIVAIEDSFDKAIDLVYKAADKIDFKGKYYRTDIGPKVYRYYLEEDLDKFRSIKEIVAQLGLDQEDIKLYSRFDIEGLKQDQAKDLLNDLNQEQKTYEGIDAFDLQKSFKKAFLVETDLVENKQIENYPQEIFVEKALVVSSQKDLLRNEYKKLKDQILQETKGSQVRLLGLPTKIS
ncbi:MAG: phosphoribosylamine--glycine ligase [Bacillota bacterium]|nr:phosphoribosylamine--glycine ligase [Bacillota bacterium]